MSKSRIVNISSSGQCELTDYGEFLAYKEAFAKLLKAFLKRIKSLDEKQREIRYKAGIDYIEKNINNADAFLDEISSIAAAIKIKEDYLQKFVASHLLNLLEKTRSSIQIEELEKIKTIADPNHLISQELLLEVGEIIKPGEKYFLENGLRNAPMEGDAKSASSLVVKKEESFEDVLNRMPSLELLKMVEQDFSASPPIDFNAKTEDSKAAQALQMGKVVKPKVEGPQPTSELMDKVQPMFSPGSPSLYDLYLKKQEDAKASKKKGSLLKKPETKIDTKAIDNQIQVLSRNLLNFKIYYELMLKLASFQSNPQGYKQWLQSEALPVQKAIIELRNNLILENKNQTVDWVEFNNKWAKNLEVNPESITQLKNDVLLYDKSKAYLRRLESRVTQHCRKSNINAAPHLKNVQSILLEIFDKKDSLSAKKRALKMIRLKVASPGIAKLIETAALQELPFIAKLYGIKE